MQKLLYRVSPTYVRPIFGSLLWLSTSLLFTSRKCNYICRDPSFGFKSHVAQACDYDATLNGNTSPVQCHEHVGNRPVWSPVRLLGDYWKANVPSMIVDCRIQNNRGRARGKDQTPDRRSAAFTFCCRGIWLIPNINMYVRNLAFV